VLAEWQHNKPKTKYQFCRVTSSDIEITKCKLAEIESEWHRATHPSKLLPEADYNEQGASSCLTDGRAVAKSSPEVARGGKWLVKKRVGFLACNKDVRLCCLTQPIAPSTQACSV